MLGLAGWIRDKVLAPPPSAARAERRLDHKRPPAPDPGINAVVAACTDWLCAAQDCSASQDGGVARHYSLTSGWGTSYPETTGYIIPTIIEVARRTERVDLHARARRMLDWCVGIQFPCGGFQGGTVGATPCVPVTFNTGQILLGLAAGTAAYGEERYRLAMHRGARWLQQTQDPDGCWRKYPSPFANAGEKAYETHVAWGLFEADRVAPGNGYGETGLRQIEWALTKQAPNGWFACNCVIDPSRPLTHAIGYVLRGLIEGYRFSGRSHLLAAARRTADSLADCIAGNGSLAGQLDRNFAPAADYVCLTGSAQIAHCMFQLSQLTSEERYFAAGRRATAYVRRTIHVDGPPETRGGVKGSFPVDGAYGQWEFLNWAAKFCIDANLLESDLQPERHGH
jgi:hypothetical protein